MKFRIRKEDFLGPLQLVNGAVERRQTLPILSNVLVSLGEGVLKLSATDMEVEIVATIELEGDEPGDITVPARKVTDICRALPANAEIEFRVEGDRATIRSGRSRFNVGSLPASDFPSFEGGIETEGFSVERVRLKQLLERTQFAMAQQDVRYYLNGLLLEAKEGRLRSVATDGHRLALCEIELGSGESGEVEGVIVPRKGVIEMSRVLADAGEEVRVGIGGQAVRVSSEEVRLTSKLIDGKFPDYRRVIPREEECSRRAEGNREALKQSLSRVAILSNEKYRAVRLCFESGLVRMLAHNPEQEEAEEEVEIGFEGEPLEVGFNVAYLIDALSAIPSEKVQMELTDGNSSCLIRGEGEEGCRYVVMPLRL